MPSSPRRPCLMIAATALLLAACGNNKEQGVIVASGHVEATEVRVATKVGGTLESITVSEGDRVSAGQQVAHISTVDLDLALAAARADRDMAAAELQLRIAGPRAEEIADARAQVAAVEVELAAAERDAKRLQGLLDAGSGTEKSRDDTRTRRDVAARHLESARQKLKRLEEGSRAEEIDGARARHAAATARVNQIEQQIKDATIASPASGIVTEKLVEKGELLMPGTVLAVVTDLSQPWLTAYVTEPDLGRIRMGQAARVVTDDGQQREGRISFIASSAEFTPKNVQTRDERVKLVYKVKIELPNDDGLFKPGMPSEARLVPASGAKSAGAKS